MAELTVKAWGMGVNSVVRHKGKLGIIIGPQGEGIILLYASGESVWLDPDTKVVPVVTGREAAFQYCKILAAKQGEGYGDSK